MNDLREQVIETLPFYSANGLAEAILRLRSTANLIEPEAARCGVLLDTDMSVAKLVQRTLTDGSKVFDIRLCEDAKKREEAAARASVRDQLAYELAKKQPAEPAAPAARPTPEQLLERAAKLQIEFWSAIGELEGALKMEIDSTRDLDGLSIADLENCDEEDEDEDEE